MTMNPADLMGLGMQVPGDGPESRFVMAGHREIQEMVDWAKNQYEAIKNARSHLERQWYLNLAFYFGKQNVVYRGTPNFVQGANGSLYVPPAPYYRVRPVINRIRPTIRTELTKLTSQKPSAFVIPASSEDRDLFAAQAGEQIWEATYRRKKVASIIRRALFWTLTCGTGFIKASWNASTPDYDSNQMGDFDFHPETPFHIFVPDFRTEEMEDQPFMLHAQLRTREQLELMFPGVGINAQEKSGSEILDDTWLNLVGANNLADKKSVLVLEVWVKPGAVKLFPQGAMFTVVGDTIVQGIEGWPYQHNRFPIAKIDHIPSGKFYADSSIIDLIPLQREYNRTRGQIIEAKNRMAKPQLIAPRGSVEPHKITSEPGQVILYQPGFEPPQPLPLQSIPSYVLQELDRILMDMSDISGQHEITRGQVPPGVTAATAISYLQEQDESKLAHTYASLEEAIEKVAHMTLSYVGQFWDYPRTVRLVGQDGSFDVMAFKGSDLSGNNDVKVEAGSALPTSKAAKQAFIMDMMKMGFIDPNKGLEVMEIGGLGKIYEAIQVDVRQAQRENLRMAAITAEVLEEYTQGLIADLEARPEKYFDLTTGEPIVPVDPMGQPQFPLIVPVNTWDEHRIHIEIHNKYRKSQAFENLPEEAKEIFEEHVKQHVAQIVVGQMAAGPAGIMEGNTDPAQMQEEGQMLPPEMTGGAPEGGPSLTPPPMEGGQPNG